MAQTTLDFSSNIVDGTASGSSGDNRLQVGDFVFIISAQGNWTANFDNGRFNFAEDASVGEENFKISITTASGNLVDFYNYTVGVSATPWAIGKWPTGVAVDNTLWSTDGLHGGPSTYLTLFPGAPAPTPGASAVIDEPDVPDTTTSGTVSFWLDNVTFETSTGGPNVAPSFGAAGNNPVFFENGAAVDLFSSVSASANNPGQTFESMTLTVTNALGKGETLGLGGKNIVLTDGAKGAIDGVGLYSISISGGVATVKLYGMTIPGSSLSNLVDGMTFSVPGDNPGFEERVVTITSVGDIGGSNYLTSTHVASTVGVSTVNNDPTGSATATLTHGREDTAYTVSATDLLKGFTDPDGDPMSISGLAASDGATVKDNGNGTYTITPVANFNGEVDLTYVVNDDAGGSKSATQTVIFDAVNDLPTGSPTASLANGKEDTAYVVTSKQLLEGFTDPDRDPLTVSAVTATGGATVTDNHDGTYTIMPAANFNGQITLTYLVADSGAPLMAHQTLTFDPVNDAPTGSATATLAHGAEDIPYVVTAEQLRQGFSDADGDTLTISGLSASNGATVTDNHDGTYTITPATHFSGAVKLSYTLSDGNGGSKEATLSFVLDETNTPDIVVNGSTQTYTENQGAVRPFSVSVADTMDVGQTFSAMTLTVSNVSSSGEILGVGGVDIALTDGASGTLTTGGTYSVSVTGGLATINISGMALGGFSMLDLLNQTTFRVDGDNPGSADRVVTLVSVTDSGASNNTVMPNVSSTIHVVPTNDAPDGSATATLIHGAEDTPYTVSAAELLKGFTDADGDKLAVSGLAASDGATVTDNHDGTYTITPVADFNGTISLTYSVDDGHSGTKTATQSFIVDPANDAPTGSATALLAHGTEDASYTVTVEQLKQGFSDIDGDTLTISGLAASDGATVVDNHDGTYTITPVADFNGTVTLSYSVGDGNGGSKAATQSLVIDPTNDAPIGSATATLANGTEDTPYIVTAEQLKQGFSDIDGDTLTISGLTASAGATVTDNHDGTYTITPAADFNGPVTLSYSVIDGNGGSKAATQSFILDAANDAPAGSATATLAHGTEDTPYTVKAADLLQGFSDVDGDTPAVSNLTASGGATVTDNRDGTYTITPVADFNGVVTLSYSVVDGHGGSKAATQSVVIDPTNDAPTGSAAAALAHGAEDTPYIVKASDLLQGFSDIDGDTPLVSGLAASNGATVTDNHDGTYTITPVADFNGVVTLSYSVVDGHGGSKAATQSFVIDPGNDAPTGSATATLANGTEDTPYIVKASDLLQGFSDIDGDTPAVSGLTASNGATVTDNHDGTYTITPVADFNGTVNLSYSVVDGHGGSKAATQSFVLDPTNDAPTGTATAVLAHGTEDTPYVVSAADLLKGFSDIDGDTPVVSGLTASDGAMVADNHDGTYTIIPVDDFNGTINLSYSVVDGHGGSKAATQSIVLDPVADAPTGSATATLAHGTEDTPYTVTSDQLKEGISDNDGDTLLISGLTASGGASVADNGDGTYTITPVADFNGTVTLSYSVVDGHGGSIDASQSIEFDATNDAPVANNDTGAMKEHGTKAFDVLANDTDVDSVVSAINPVVRSHNGSVTINSDGDLVVSYTGRALDKGETAKVVVAYDATDGTATDRATLTVNVTGVYDAGEDIDGSNKGETINGTNKGERISGFGGDDTINGRGGDDSISGGSGKDVIRGGAGNDNLRAGEGGDRMFGGKGNDRLVGWAGDDIMTGGKGRDTFVFHVFDGKDIVTDFDATGKNHDRLDLSAWSKFDTFAAVKEVMHQEGHSTVIDLPGDNSITLKHVEIHTLGRDDFLF